MRHSILILRSEPKASVSKDEARDSTVLTGLMVRDAAFHAAPHHEGLGSEHGTPVTNHRVKPPLDLRKGMRQTAGLNGISGTRIS